jgi:hypothetical protein
MQTASAVRPHVGKHVVVHDLQLYPHYRRSESHASFTQYLGADTFFGGPLPVIRKNAR